ncbi:MAG: hypothetical protein ABI461_15605, partial [Polyangiaceae bacterium]
LATACTIPDSAYSAPTSSPTLPPETRPGVTSSSSLALSANALKYNPTDGLLYASVSGSTPSQGNAIAVIDPTSASIVASIYVGPEPTKIAISDDGKVLWVAISNSSSIRRVDLTTRVAGASFALPPSSSIYDLAVLPGTQDSVVVSSYSYPYSSGSSLLIYDNGTPRPYGVHNNQQLAQAVVTSSSALLFASTTYGYPPALAPVCVDSSGVFLTNTIAAPPNYYGSYAGAVFSAGAIYTSDGHAYDAQSGALLATFTLPLGSYGQLVAIDETSVYFLTVMSHPSEGYWVQANGFDRVSYAATGTDLLFVNGGPSGNFVRWGRYGFAFTNNGQSIVISRSTIIPDEP